MPKTETAEINGATYGVTKLATRAGGMKVFRHLQKKVFEMIGTAFDAQVGKGKWSDLGAMVGDLIADDKTFGHIQQLMLTLTYNGAEIGNEPDHWDEHQPDFMEVVTFVLRVNYGDSFTTAVGKIPGLQKLLDGMSQTHSTLTPPSPGSSPEE